MSRPVKLDEGFRWCRKCDTTKPLSKFYKSKKESKGRSFYCSDCVLKEAKIYYSLKRTEIIARNQEDRKLIRKQVLELLGNKCVKCGFSDSRALQIDHIFGGGTKSRQKGDPRLFYRAILHGKVPIETVQLLCANCNWIKIEENGERNRG